MPKSAAKKYEHEYDAKRPLDIAAMELERKLGEAIIDRSCVEQRMLEDLMQYGGVEDLPSIEINGKPKDDDGRAKVFIKLTRTKTNAGIAQLVDLLFPNDDKNWGIKATPNPDMADMLEDGDSPVEFNGATFQYQDGKPVTKADIAKRSEELANDRAEKMEKLINDQLIEARYNSVCRSMLWDAGVVGTGVLKGPVVARDRKRAFLKMETGEHALVIKEEFKPGTEWVRPWDFFPDMSASEIDECEFVFERRYMSRKQIRKLVGRKGFPQDQVNKVLLMTPEQTQHRSTFQDDIRRVAGLTDTINDTRYETWEYHGPMADSVLAEIGVIPIDAAEENGERDAVVFYCGGIVMGAKLAFMDYERGFPYRVFNWERDHGSLFGLGLPAIIRDEQATVNTVWRQILDNGAASAGPQVGARKGAVSPQDGSWAFRPFKVWDIDDDAQITDIRQAFSTFDVPSNLQELSMILDRARVFLDEVSGVPMMQQGEQGQATPTLGGMSMLMNAANTVRRAQVKMWDDDITTPLISDFYAFNMLNSDDEGVKGDFSVDARGTSSLLIKEQVGQAMTNFIAAAGSSPVFAPVLALKAPQLLREWAKTQQIPTSCIPTEDELIKWQQEQQEAAQNGGAQDPAMMVEQMRAEQQAAKLAHEKELEQFKAQQRQQELAADFQLKRMQMGAELQKQERQERIEMMKLAQGGELKAQELATRMKEASERNALEWDKFMAEVSIKQQAGITSNYGLE